MFTFFSSDGVSRSKGLSEALLPPENDLSRTIAVTRNVFSEALMKIEGCNHLQVS